jgi:hypothetical protein
MKTSRCWYNKAQCRAIKACHCPLHSFTRKRSSLLVNLYMVFPAHDESVEGSFNFVNRLILCDGQSLGQ